VDYISDTLAKLTRHLLRQRRFLSVIYMPPNQYVHCVLESNFEKRLITQHTAPTFLCKKENTEEAYPKIGAENVWVASGHQKDALDTFAQ